MRCASKGQFAVVAKCDESSHEDSVEIPTHFGTTQKVERKELINVNTSKIKIFKISTHVHVQKLLPTLVSQAARNIVFNNYAYHCTLDGITTVEAFSLFFDNSNPFEKLLSIWKKDALETLQYEELMK